MSDDWELSRSSRWGATVLRVSPADVAKIKSATTEHQRLLDLQRNRQTKPRPDMSHADTPHQYGAGRPPANDVAAARAAATSPAANAGPAGTLSTAPSAEQRPVYQQLAIGDPAEQVLPTAPGYEPDMVLNDTPNVTLPGITVKKGRWRPSVTVIGLLVNAGSLWTARTHLSS